LESVANDASARFSALNAKIPELNEKFKAPDSVENLAVNIRSLSANLAEQIEVLDRWASAIESAQGLVKENG